MSKDVNDFFNLRNTVDGISDDDKLQTSDYLAPIRAFARTTYKSIYIIDYEKKGFEYVSHNPLFLCGHSPEEVKEMGYAFYFKYVTKPDLDLLLKINEVGFEFYDKLPVEDRLLYTISYDFNIKNQKGDFILINQKLTPFYLTREGKVWKAICIISLSTEQSSGNIKTYKQGDNKMFRYDMEGNFWRTEDKLKLTTREKEILQYSARGFKINEIAEAIFVSPDTVKFHRKKLYDKLDVTNITEAISFATNNKLI